MFPLLVVTEKQTFANQLCDHLCRTVLFELNQSGLSSRSAETALIKVTNNLHVASKIDLSLYLSCISVTIAAA